MTPTASVVDVVYTEFPPLWDYHTNNNVFHLVRQLVCESISKRLERSPNFI